MNTNIEEYYESLYKFKKSTKHQKSILLNFTNTISLNTLTPFIPIRDTGNDCTFEKRDFPPHIHYKWINVDNWGNFVGHEFHCVLTPRQT